MNIWRDTGQSPISPGFVDEAGFSMPSTHQTALLVTGLYVVAVLLWGFLVSFKPLLSILYALLGGIAYLVWRLFMYQKASVR